MKSLADVVQFLTKSPCEALPLTAAQLLIRDEDWWAIIRKHIGLSEADFCATVLRAHVAHVEPRVFLLHEEAGKFQIILNHFDRPAFDMHWEAGRLGPHYHHFAFSTRLLRGSYYHWLFDNEGDLRRPQLKLALQGKCETGDVYTIPYHRFHCVFTPEHDTMSLMVRGRAVFAPGHPLDPSYDASKILQARARLLKLLSTAPPSQPGRLACFKPVEA